MAEEIVTVAQAARIAGKTGKTIRNWIDNVLGVSEAPSVTVSGDVPEVVSQLLAEIRRLQEENRELAGRAGFYQGQLEELRPLLPEPQQRPWWRRVLRR